MSSDSRPGASNTANEPFFILLVIATVVLVITPLMWPMIAPKLTPAMLWIAQAHLAFFPWLSDSAASQLQTLQEIRRDGRVLTSGGAWTVLNDAGRFMYWLATPAFLYWILKPIIKPAGRPEWRKVLSKFDLINQQAQFWPASYVVKDLDLLDPKLASHPYRRRALSPLEWAMRERVLHSVRCVRVGTEGDREYFDEAAPPEASRVSRVLPLDRIGIDRIVLMYGVLDDEKAESAFSDQLGSKFSAFTDMSPLHRGLVCFLLAHAGRDRQLEWKVQMELIRSKGAPGKHCQEAWDRFGSMQFVTEAIRDHAYNSTVLRRLITDSKRLGGKMETWYVWLKAVDFATYLNFNDDGRLTGWSEVAGVRSQYQAELVLARFNEEQLRKGQKPMKGGKPQMNEAVKALRKYLQQTGVLTGEARLLD